MHDLLLLTNDKLYLITHDSLLKYNITIRNYLRNSGDSLKLKRTVLKKLHNIQYPYIINFKLDIDKEKCKNRLTSKIFYRKFCEEYNKFYLHCE